jgi:hypothetical protein
MNVASTPEEELHAKAVWRLADRIWVASHGRGDPKEELRRKGEARRVRGSDMPGVRRFGAGRSKAGRLRSWVD